MFARNCLILSLMISPFCATHGFSAEKTIQYSFATGSQQWIGDFTDYPQGKEQFYELAWGWENLPNNQDQHTQQLSTIFSKGIFLSGNNHSDDLFMYIKTPILGLKANTAYAVTLSINLATNAPSGLIGIGGSPGESVTLKVGASTEEPNKLLRKGFYKLNVDKGDQLQGGKNVVVVGNLANPLVDAEHRQFALKQVQNTGHPIVVNSDEKGQLWVFVGTDSGFEGLSKYYIGEITVKLQEKQL